MSLVNPNHFVIHPNEIEATERRMMLHNYYARLRLILLQLYAVVGRTAGSVKKVT